MGNAATESHFDTTIIFPRHVGLPPLVMETCDGGQLSSNIEKRGRGGATKSSSLAGPGELSNIVSARSWEPGRDAAIAARLRPLQAAVSGVKIIKQPKGADRLPHPTDPPEIWNDCTFLVVSSPKHDDNSSTTGMLTLEFSTNEPAA